MRVQYTICLRQCPTTTVRGVSSDGSPPRPHRFIGVTLLALSAALAASYVFVIRPAEQESRPITAEDLVGAQVDRGATDESIAEIGATAPPVGLTGFDGTPIKIADLSGKPVVINFWASTCVPCIKEMPLLERAFQRHGNNVEFLGIDVFESPELGSKMIADTGVTYRQAVDPTNEVLTRFGGVQLPHTVVLRADGTVSALHNEPITEDAEIDRLIEEATA